MKELTRSANRVELEAEIAELERKVDEARFRREYKLLGDLRLALVRAKESYGMILEEV